MRTLVAKEIRLLLPAFGMALLLAIVPVLLLGSSAARVEARQYVFPLFCFGTLFMALTSFGREFGMGTFPLLLAMPLQRARIWWTKIAVLVSAMVIAFGVFLILARMRGQLMTAGGTWFGDAGGAAGLVVAFVVIIASGLWTTLLLRQMVGAFWFALLIPLAILTLILWNGGSALAAEIVLVLYSIGGFWWAWRQFNRAQEVAWTGGEISLPEWPAAGANARSAGRTYRPTAAFLGKELRLYQIALAGMAGLFLLHLGVIALRKTMQGNTEDSLFRNALNLFGGLWLLVPLISGSLNVADERRLGTMEAHLCLPVSRRVQFIVKFAVMLCLSGLLSAGLLWLAEGIATALGVGAGFGSIRISLQGGGLARLLAIFLSFSLVVFYASTLARNILQAVITAVAVVFVLMFVWGIAMSVRSIMGFWLWEWPLLSVIAAPTMTVVIVWLAYSNFRRLSESRRLWLRNLRGLAGGILFTGVFTALIFNRAWECLTPLEPPHGAARLNRNKFPILSFNWHSVSVLLPHGRMWWEPVAYESPEATDFFGTNSVVALGSGKWGGLDGNHFLRRSNWVDVADVYGQTAAIQSDGTLWISERAVHPYLWQNKRPFPQPHAPLVKFGDEHKWKSVVANGDDLLLLKTDGTLWRLGTNRNNSSGDLYSMKPRRLGTDSNWSRLFSSPTFPFIWKSDGRAWKFSTAAQSYGASNTFLALEPDLTLQRWETFDNMKWRSLAGYPPFQLGVREDGTLWAMGIAPTNFFNINDHTQLVPSRVGTNDDWISVAGDNRTLFGLKTDGTLWKWNTDFWWYQGVAPFSKPPVRFGTHDDWVAISGSDHLWALAADGTLWYWTIHNYNSELLAPSRKPVEFSHLFPQE